MRSKQLLLLVAIAVAACARGQGGRLADTAPAHTPPKRTDPFGEWVLGTDPDSTGAFAGASLVTLAISPSRFTVIATYPTGEPWVVTGTAQVLDDGSRLRLVPETNSRSSGNPSVPLAPGRPVDYITGAADNSMVFAPLDATLGFASSHWHRRDAAAAAGLITTRAAAGAVARDSVTKKPKRP